MRAKFLCMFLIQHVMSIQYVAFENHFLDVETMKMFEVMSFQLCIRECCYLSGCAAINHNHELLRCELLDKQFSEAHLSKANGSTYAYITDAGMHGCSLCAIAETFIQLDSGNSTCIPSECLSRRPVVQNAKAVLWNSPPKVMFTCLSGYTEVGTQANSSCMPGSSWTPISYRCEAPVNGGWSSWNLWGACKEPILCLGGSKTRYRSCTKPSPMYGGLSCSGAYYQSVGCWCVTEIFAGKRR